MEFSLITSPSESNQTDCLILGIFENQKHSPESSGFNLQTQGFIDTIIQRDNFDGTLGNTLTINFIPNNLYQRCVLVGLGNPNQPLSSKNYRKLLTSTIKALKNTPSLMQPAVYQKSPLRIKITSGRYVKSLRSFKAPVINSVT